jgi:hypothetical protein
MSIRLDIPINQSPVPAAIDNFYEFLTDNINAGPNDRIALLGTLVEFDITEKSLLYNDFVVRAFSDRSVRVSPVPGQAAGDFADRYSARYTDMLKQIIEELDTQLNATDQAQIDRLDAAMQSATIEMLGWIRLRANGKSRCDGWGSIRARSIPTSIHEGGITTNE